MNFFKNKTIVILGSGIMQLPLISTALKRGMHVAVLDKKFAQLSENPTKTPLPSSLAVKNAWLNSFSYHSRQAPEKLNLTKLYLLPCNFSNVSASYEQLKNWLKISNAPHPSAVLTVGTDFSTSVSALSSKLKVKSPYTPYEVAYKCTHKGAMRKALTAAGILQPAYFLIQLSTADATLLRASHPQTNKRTYQTLLQKISRTLKERINSTRGVLSTKKKTSERNGALNRMDWPLVVKPANSMGARGVMRVENLQEAVKACCKAALHSPTAEVIIEELILGTGAWRGEISVDALVCNNKFIPYGIANRIIGRAPHFVESGHTIPANRSMKVIEKCWETFQAATAALGLTHGAAKGDLMLAGNGNVVVGEVAARLSGGYMSGYTYPLSSGVDLMDAMLHVGLGKMPHSLPPSQAHTHGMKNNKVVVERAKILPPGIIKSISGIEMAIAMPNVHHLFLNQAEGMEVSKAENNLMKFANVIASGDTLQNANSNARKALAQLNVVLRKGKNTKTY